MTFQSLPTRLSVLIRFSREVALMYNLLLFRSWSPSSFSRLENLHGTDDFCKLLSSARKDGPKDHGSFTCRIITIFVSNVAALLNRSFSLQ